MEGCGGLWRKVEGCGGLWRVVHGFGGSQGLWRIVGSPSKTLQSPPHPTTISHNPQEIFQFKKPGLAVTASCCGWKVTDGVWRYLMVVGGNRHGLRVTNGDRMVTNGDHRDDIFHLVLERSPSQPPQSSTIFHNPQQPFTALHNPSQPFTTYTSTKPLQTSRILHSPPQPYGGLRTPQGC